jgi:hypothetical protein
VKDKQTIGQRIVAPLILFAGSIPHRNSEALLKIKAGKLAGEIDAAIADAFKTGFEHAVKGGKEASRKLPQLKGAMPLVLYFGNDKDRQEFADMIHEAKPHMIEIKVPEGT